MFLYMFIPLLAFIANVFDIAPYLSASLSLFHGHKSAPVHFHDAGVMVVFGPLARQAYELASNLSQPIHDPAIAQIFTLPVPTPPFHVALPQLDIPSRDATFTPLSIPHHLPSRLVEPLLLMCSRTSSPITNVTSPLPAFTIRPKVKPSQRVQVYRLSPSPLEGISGVIIGILILYMGTGLMLFCIFGAEDSAIGQVQEEQVNTKVEDNVNLISPSLRVEWHEGPYVGNEWSDIALPAASSTPLRSSPLASPTLSPSISTKSAFVAMLNPLVITTPPNALFKPCHTAFMACSPVESISGILSEDDLDTDEEKILMLPPRIDPGWFDDGLDDTDVSSTNASSIALRELPPLSPTASPTSKVTAKPDRLPIATPSITSFKADHNVDETLMDHTPTDAELFADGIKGTFGSQFEDSLSVAVSSTPLLPSHSLGSSPVLLPAFEQETREHAPSLQVFASAFDQDIAKPVDERDQSPASGLDSDFPHPKTKPWESDTDASNNLFVVSDERRDLPGSVPWWPPSPPAGNLRDASDPKATLDIDDSPTPLKVDQDPIAESLPLVSTSPARPRLADIMTERFGTFTLADVACARRQGVPLPYADDCVLFDSPQPSQAQSRPATPAQTSPVAPEYRFTDSHLISDSGNEGDGSSEVESPFLSSSSSTSTSPRLELERMKGVRGDREIGSMVRKSKKNADRKGKAERKREKARLEQEKKWKKADNEKKEKGDEKEVLVDDKKSDGEVVKLDAGDNMDKDGVQEEGNACPAHTPILASTPSLSRSTIFSSPAQENLINHLRRRSASRSTPSSPRSPQDEDYYTPPQGPSPVPTLLSPSVPAESRPLMVGPTITGSHYGLALWDKDGGKELGSSGEELGVAAATTALEDRHEALEDKREDEMKERGEEKCQEETNNHNSSEPPPPFSLPSTPATPTISMPGHSFDGVSASMWACPSLTLVSLPPAPPSTSVASPSLKITKYTESPQDDKCEGVQASMWAPHPPTPPPPTPTTTNPPALETPSKLADVTNLPDSEIDWATRIKAVCHSMPPATRRREDGEEIEVDETTQGRGKRTRTRKRKRGVEVEKDGMKRLTRAPPPSSPVIWSASSRALRVDAQVRQDLHDVHASRRAR